MRTREKNSDSVASSRPRVSARTVRRVCEVLEQAYGRPRLGNPEDPLDDLVYVLLSNKSAPVRAQRAFEELRRRFATWREVAEAAPADVIELLRPTGFATKRTHQIHSILQTLARDFGRYSLDDLKGKDKDEVFLYLTSLLGVSDKVARCVMMYTMGFEVLPVDAHMHRVARRLGWTQIDRPENSHEELESLVPPKLRYGFHVDCVAHGRELCRAPKPICEPCPIKRFCSYYASVLSHSKHVGTQDRR